MLGLVSQNYYYKQWFLFLFLFFCQTWNGVIQDKPKEPSDEHVCGEEHYDHLVQLFYSLSHKRE